MKSSLILVLLLAVTATTSVVSASAVATAEGQYNSTLAMIGWFYSKSSFCNRTDIADWTCPTCAKNPGMVDVQVFHNETTGGQAYVGYNTETNFVVVAFRGSADIPNWINDLDFFFIDYPAANGAACTSFSGSQCQVHRGFLNVYQTITAQGLLQHAQTLMTRYASRSPKVLVTGHSLGAALAILGAVDVSLAFKSITSEIHIYTYGEPRVGNPAWAKWVSESVIVGGKQYRVTHEADPVPRVPPLEFGFLHVPHEVWYNNDDAGNNYTVCVDNATAEDYTNCENTQYAFVPADHLLYLGVKSGCDAL